MFKTFPNLYPEETGLHVVFKAIILIFPDLPVEHLDLVDLVQFQSKQK